MVGKFKDERAGQGGNSGVGGEGMEKEQTTIRLPAELKKRLQQEADKIGVSFNEIVIKLLNERLNSYSFTST